MKVSKSLDLIASGHGYDEKALLKCIGLKLIIRHEYFAVVQRYLAGSDKPSDRFLLQDLAICLRKVGA